jgi:hypothetical protein
MADKAMTGLSFGLPKYEAAFYKLYPEVYFGFQLLGVMRGIILNEV